MTDDRALPPAEDRATAVEPVPVSPLRDGIPSAGCVECERLREEIADYMGHRTDSVAGKVWAAQMLFSNFEDGLSDIIGEFDGLGHDSYDQSLEIYGAAADLRLNLEAQLLIKDAGFGRVYVNHGAKGDEYRQETHYTLNGELPARGWRRRYVADASSSHDRIIVGDPDPGYWEISYWPDGWANREANLASGQYRIVPDPLDAQGMETRQGGDG